MLRLTRTSALLPRDQLVGTSQAVRHYAAKAAGGSKKKAAQAVNASRGSGRPGEGSDSRVDAIKKILYESKPTTDDRLARVAKVIPSAEVHETISRAWQLHTRHEREAHAAELARKYNAMRSAIDLLEQTDSELFRMATTGKMQNVVQKGAPERLEGLFPKESHVPMETSSQGQWDKDWKRPKVAE